MSDTEFVKLIKSTGITFDSLLEWRKQMRETRTVAEMKSVGRSFRDSIGKDLSDSEILTVLKDGKRVMSVLEAWHA